MFHCVSLLWRHQSDCLKNILKKYIKRGKCPFYHWQWVLSNELFCNPFWKQSNLIHDFTFTTRLLSIRCWKWKISISKLFRKAVPVCAVISVMWSDTKKCCWVDSTRRVMQSKCIWRVGMHGLLRYQFDICFQFSFSHIFASLFECIIKKIYFSQHELDHLNGQVFVDIMEKKTFSCAAWEAVNFNAGKLHIPFYPVKQKFQDNLHPAKKSIVT